jgi:hypothetical protein
MLDRLMAKLEEKRDRWDERGYVDALARLSDVELHRFLSKSRLRRVLRVLHRKWKDVHSRNALIDLLLPKEIVDLDVELRVEFIHALQQGRTSHRDEVRIVEILCATSGDELLQLKEGVDHQDHHNLYNLVYHDIDSEPQRKRVLQHFIEQADDSLQIRIISDIDDTIYANWRDEKFPKKTLYPGVRSFFSRLDSEQNKLVFLTARPKDRGHLSERLTRKRLQSFGFAHPVVLVGSWQHVHSDEAILEKKWHNIQRYKSLYPKSRFIFIGDSGQLDVELAQRMHTEGFLELGLIHDIIPYRPLQWKEQFSGVYFFKTYTEAAIYAWERGVLSKEDAEFVCNESEKELKEMGKCHVDRLQEWREAQIMLQNRQEKD